MATTFGTISLSNGQIVGVVQLTNGPVNSVLAVDPSKPADAGTNTLDFMIQGNQNASIVDWESGAIASGALEIYANGYPTGKICILAKCQLATVTRVFPRVTLRPGVKYSLRVATVLPA